MISQEDELHAILNCTNPPEVFQLLLKEAARLGLQNVSWGIKLPTPTMGDRLVLLSNYSLAWQERYAEEEYLAIDPTVKYGLGSTLPVLWSDPHIQKSAPEFWEEARSYGLNEGIAQSVWDRHGACSLLSLSRDSLQFTHTEFAWKIPKIIQLAQLAHACMTRLILSKEAPETAGDLLSSEKEVLKLAATGMTQQEISERMNRTLRTVNFHLENAKDKLAASNRTDAVCEGIILGLI